MEIQLIYGPNNSGKSKYAEDVAATGGKKLVYLATMVPQNEENLKRIEKHRIQRQDKGFQTIEAGWHIGELEVESDAVILLEDASNLVANGIFMHGADAEKAYLDILTLAGKCKKLIVVSIGGLSAEGYDEETTHYIEQLNWLNEKLAGEATTVVEMSVDETGKSKKKVIKAEEKNYAYFQNKSCEYFPCHEGADPEDHNCLFCYCPLYVLGEDCGGQFRYTKSGRKDCGNCTFPHKRGNYEQIEKRYHEIVERTKRKI